MSNYKNERDIMSQNKKLFYVTTPIYYPSAQLHIGHAYTTTLADILNRYKKLDGYETFFLTGSDEHGEKIQKKAKEAGITPYEFTTMIVNNFKLLWNKLGIEYSKFIRTTDKTHELGVQKIFSKLYHKGDIYLGEYEGLYCVSCEEFLTESQLDKTTQQCLVCGNKPKKVKEETYFFKVSKYSQFLINYYNEHPDFIEPEARKNEMLNNFILPGLTDLSVTRTTFSWGIKTLENDKHIIYVWIDALSNYLTGLGYLSDDETLFNKFWNNPDVEILQLLGKEIARFHTIYWPSMLESLELRQPNKLLSHGWILFKDTKMSKSIGNVVDPLYLIDQYGRDVLRFYLGYEIPTDNDGKFSYEMFFESYNTHLVNNIGNLVSRVSNMISKYFNGELLSRGPLKNDLIDSCLLAIKSYQVAMNNYQISKALSIVLELCNKANKYIEESKPWELEKNQETAQLHTTLATLAYVIVVSAFLLQPVLIDHAQKIADYFNIDLQNLTFSTILSQEMIYNKRIEKKENLFERLNVEQELKRIETELN
ncbi:MULTISPECIES: methionine--tRNA ligase [unclassified Spiroplasma]|uniref:methionine--tRNA ligase n=1 Tax=unclassified Spiroplasma TaxID=2637901 RepID=UPI00214F6E4C|nr:MULTISPECIES: methionine--tRNA ligase [unclassified Spiroplasma]